MSNSFSATNCKGRQVNLLNDDEKEKKRKYQCTKCQKDFTTSGHLARHFRIHTGEKNFYCIYPGCSSRFSRQDNMMQHYKTHLSSKSRMNRYYNYHQREYDYFYGFSQALPPLRTPSWTDNMTNKPKIGH